VNLVSLGTDVDWPDSEAGTAVREQLAGSDDLGHLAAVAEWWRSVRPRESLDRVRLLHVGAPVPSLVVEVADEVGASCREVDGGGDVASAATVIDEEVDAGADLLILAVPGVEADAAIAVSALTNTEPVKVLARGVAAADPDAWMDRAIAVRDGRRAAMTVRSDPDKLLAEIASDRLCVAAALALHAAARRTPVLLDGPVAAAAALVAYEAQPRAVRWWAAADRGTDPLHELALTRMGQHPILGLRTGRGDGLAGLLTLPVIRAAARLGG
jgi:nicotinate-nucleotide--dimethylbenzimidazole phosphoribosyltransferase